MKKFIATAISILVFVPCQVADETKTSHIVLPRPKLLRCKAAECCQLWSEKPGDSNTIFPKQTIVNMDQGCLYGLTALYDKSIPVADVQSASNRAYGSWVYGDSANSPVKLWRVTPEKFSIQLSIANKTAEKRNFAEAGTRLVIYIAFAGGGKSACSIP